MGWCLGFDISITNASDYKGKHFINIHLAFFSVLCLKNWANVFFSSEVEGSDALTCSLKTSGPVKIGRTCPNISPSSTPSRMLISLKLWDKLDSAREALRQAADVMWGFKYQNHAFNYLESGGSKNRV